MQTKLEALRKLLGEMFPDYIDRVICLSRQSDGSLDINLHGFTSYREGTQALRALGIGKRDKQIFGDGLASWCTIAGKLTDVDTIKVYCDGLPPSCRLEYFTEKIPVEQTVTTENFVEVKRSRVVCAKDDLRLAVEASLVGDTNQIERNSMP